MPDRCRACEYWRRVGKPYPSDKGYGCYRMESVGCCDRKDDQFIHGSARACDLFELVEGDDGQSLPQG